ncbi:MAG: O-antigen ligase family protein [Taibaiella sp.]|nr:O-antigen ligase family protein [Taibaiella sp.]
MSKSSFLNNKKLTKSDIAVISILIMVGGLLISRLFLSVGMLIFGVNALWGVHPRTWLRDKWWLTGLAWVGMYALSGLWSTDKETWGVLLQVKLPVLLLPVSFYCLPAFSRRQLELLTLGIGLMLLAGACYSVSFLILHYQHYIQEYNVSHMIPTPVYGEYICFSMTIALYICWCVYMWPSLNTRPVKWFTGFVMALLAVYLHVLASKSGLLALYIFIIGWGLYLTIARRSVAGLVVVLSLPVVLTLAVTYIPTLHERKEHIIYTWYRYMDNDKSGRLGDLSRIASYDIALKLIKEHPIAGVGAGDMMPEMIKGYEKWYPSITEQRNRLIPHNQFMTVGFACGLPAMALFIIWVFMPLRRMGRNRESFFFFIIWLSLLMQLMVEPFLEGQFGVFVYLFFILFFRNVLPGRLTAYSGGGENLNPTPIIPAT